MRFWDASAIVPLIVDTAEATLADESYSREPMVVWWGTIVEATSAIARRERAGSLPQTGVAASLSLLSDLGARWIEVPPTDGLRRVAQRLVRVHALRAADSLQLAAALTCAGGELDQVDFVCRDNRLSEAAGREGLRVRAI